MASATIVNHWHNATNAYLAVMVAEGGSIGNVEYIGVSPIYSYDSNGNIIGTLTEAQIKANCIASISAQRNAQLAALVPIAASGTITV